MKVRILFLIVAIVTLVVAGTSLLDWVFIVLINLIVVTEKVSCIDWQLP